MSKSASPTHAAQRPNVLPVDGGGCTQRVAAVACSSVDRLLADIAFQRKRERQRAADSDRRKRELRRNCGADDELRHAATDETPAATTTGKTFSEMDDEAASAYWWTDMFLRYFVFDEDCMKSNIAADTDDLLFFVRRRRNKRKCSKRQSLSQRRLIAYDTRPYRKQQQQQNRLKPSMLPIGDPAVLWRHTVCLNTVIHRLRYTLTVAVCARVPRKSTSVAVTDYYYQYGDEGDCRNDDVDGFDFENGPDREYDLQLLSRHVHTVYASTSGRRMDAAKGPRERPVYPALCWAADDYAEAFRTVIVRPGQTVCAELVATWPGPATDDPADDTDEVGDDGVGGSYSQGGEERNHNEGGLPRRCKSVTAKQKQNRAVLFAGAIPYSAVRATYECKMSLYREAERQRRKLRQQQRKRGDKKSSLGAALSASLTALFTGSKDSVAAGRQSDCGGDNDYYYSAPSDDMTSGRIEYVTVRGCHEACDDDDGGDFNESSSYDGFRNDFDDISTTSATYDGTKGLAQMAVMLAPVQRIETMNTGYDRCGGDYPQNQHLYYGDVGYNEGSYGDGGGGGDGGTGDQERNYNDSTDFTMGPYYNETEESATGYHKLNQQFYQYQQQQPQFESLYPATASEPGDFYDYGWDYETTTGSGQQTPQTPSYHYQVQQQQLEWRQRRRGGRPRRLSDPCSTSVFDLLHDSGDVGQQQQYYQQQLNSNYYYNKHGCGGGWKSKQNHHQHGQHYQRYQYGATSVVTTPATPGRVDVPQQPHRAWSESDGLDRCGGGGSGGAGFAQPQQKRKRQRPLPLPPPPIPYYCAAEAAASGFVQCVHKSPSGWWTRKRNRRRSKRNKRKKRRPRQQCEQAMVANRRRSSSAGGNANHGGCYTSTTDYEDGVEDGEINGDSGSDGENSQSDDQESDGEFIGALAAAAAFGHDPDREWTRHGANPVADWDQYDSDSDSALDDTNDDSDVVEWTIEISATDIRRKPLYKKWSIPMVTSRIMMLYDNDIIWCGRQLCQVTTPVDTNHPKHHQSLNQLNQNDYQQPNRRRPPPPQFRPQPIEATPHPPALSVAFTAVALPWWTVLEDVLLVASSGGSSSSTGMPLLTFD